MVKLNKNYDKLKANYLFRDAAARRKAFQEKNPNAKIIRLGIGDVSEPLSPTVIQAIHDTADELRTRNPGYGDAPGLTGLVNSIANLYKSRGTNVSAEDIIVSCGAKEDSSNIQQIFDVNNKVALQDPAYPVYVDSNVIAGRTGKFNEQKELYDGLIYMPCLAENDFIPAIPKEKADLIYLCSPNNPTSAVLTHKQLKGFIDYAKKNNSVIIFDAAYAAFIQDKSLPKSIYEVEGSRDCAIEINSFSKSHGFTGMRLGWTVIPEEVAAKSEKTGKVKSLWNARQGRHFNEASYISQKMGIAGLTKQGLKEAKETIDFYMENAKIIKQGVKNMGLAAYGGDNAPYILAKAPEGISSVGLCEMVMEKYHIEGIPGDGFGPSGKGFVRFTAFGNREKIEEAAERMSKKKL